MSNSTLFISVIVSLLIASMCAATAPFTDRDEERYSRPMQFLAGLFFWNTHLYDIFCIA